MDTPTKLKMITACFFVVAGCSHKTNAFFEDAGPEEHFDSGVDDIPFNEAAFYCPSHINAPVDAIFIKDRTAEEVTGFFSDLQQLGMAQVDASAIVECVPGTLPNEPAWEVENSDCKSAHYTASDGMQVSYLHQSKSFLGSEEEETISQTSLSLLPATGSRSWDSFSTLISSRSYGNDQFHSERTSWEMDWNGAINEVLPADTAVNGEVAKSSGESNYRSVSWDNGTCDAFVKGKNEGGDNYNDTPVYSAELQLKEPPNSMKVSEKYHEDPSDTCILHAEVDGQNVGMVDFNTWTPCNE